MHMWTRFKSHSRPDGAAAATESKR
jgi:hypothetical protein